MGEPQVFCLQAPLLETPAVIPSSTICKGGLPRQTPKLNLRIRSSLYAKKVSQLLFQEF